MDKAFLDDCQAEYVNLVEIAYGIIDDYRALIESKRKDAADDPEYMLELEMQGEALDMMGFLLQGGHISN
jgi:hypothetical protein